MISGARWRAGLLLLLAAFTAQGCKLPSGQPDQVPVTLTLSEARPITIHQQDTLKVVARDAEGRQIADPSIAWTFSGPCCGGAPANVVDENGPDAVLAGMFPATLYVKASIDDPRFAAAALDTSLAVAYGPITVSFVGVGPDTVLTSQGGFTLKARAVDQTGAPMAYGSFVVTSAKGIVTLRWSADTMLNMNAFGDGDDTVYLTHTLCPNDCEDTLAVSLAPVATGISLDSSVCATSLGDSVPLAAVVKPEVHDAQGYPVPGAQVTWGLADPADSAVLELLDPSTGAAFTRTAGTAQVAAISGSLRAGATVEVTQATRTMRVESPSYVVGVGTPFAVSYAPFDSVGTPVSPSEILTSGWYVGPATSSFALQTTNGARDTTLTTPSYGDLYIYLYVWGGCSCGWCGFLSASTAIPLHVIHQPDSVRAYPQDGSTTLNGIGTTATWLGNIYLPDSTITAVPLIWTSLDSAVATIDAHGLVTAVSAGTARLVGSMGTTADTSVVTVTGSGP